MQKMKLSKKLLSGFLALGIGLSIVTPTLTALAASAQGTTETPQMKFTGSANSWTPTENSTDKVYLTADGMAIDSFTDFSVTGSEKDAADRYMVDENGALSLKPGKTAVNGETLTVSSNVSYYSADQLLWTDGLEKDNSLIPSATGKYCLKHSEQNPRTGLKSGTTTSENVKDGMWSPEIQSAGRLVFWYYDPATEAEMDQKALAAREETFDQVKFGMVINNYPDLLFGVGIPANADKDQDGATFQKTAESLAERLAYAATYTVRYNGNWCRTNIARTEGWHKMEINVAAGGSTLFIDGAAVCMNGEATPITVPGVTSITKAAVATNWGNKVEVEEFVNDKHFIDDMFILKSDAGSAKSASAAITITVNTADAEADAAAVADVKTAVEALKFSVAQADVKDEAAAKQKIESLVSQVADAKGVKATVAKVEYQAPVAGTLTAPDGADGYYKFTVGLAKNAASDTTKELQLNIVATKYVAKEFQLVFGQDDTGALEKGGTGRVYLENMDDYAIAGVKYTTDNPNVTVSENGTLEFKKGYTPAKDETVQVTAEVSYYDPKDVVFGDSFEGDKQFTSNSDSGVYGQSDVNSLFGRKAATAVGSTKGYPTRDLEEVTDVTVTAWYYDANGGADQTKFGFGINGLNSSGSKIGDTALGIFYDGVIAPYVDDLTKTHYGARVNGFTYNDWSWGTTDSARTKGWHKFEWVIDSQKGLTEKIDGKVVSTNSLVGAAETNSELVKVENNTNVKALTGLRLMEGWNNNATNLGEISNRHFIDGVSVVKNGAATKTAKLMSAKIPLKDVTYTVTPKTFTVDSTYPSDQTLYIAPYMDGETDVQKVLANGKELDADLWTAGMGEAPENALNYPAEMKGYQLTVNGEAFKGLAQGEHSLTIVTKAGSQVNVSFTANPSTAHVATNYYLSNNSGDDSKDGHTPETAWKSFEKLQSVTFGPGDHIYLDAQSTWSGVQFRPEGSGVPGAPIVLTKYNDGGNSSKRPILNGDGTVADLEAHSYLAFDAWRAFYPSGAVELFNVEQWEVRGLEVTNYAQEMQKGATGRNGIAVVYDYFETQGITEMPGSNAAKEQAFYRAGKLQHIVIDDCYVHDVVGYHPGNGAQGRGGKMSGGINAYGPYDDLQINNNIVMYCDVEGIRNDVLAWMGDTRTQFPAYMEDVSISNNFIAGVPGDGVVISSANKPVLENNYLTDAGYSYYAETNTSNVSVSWSAGNLSTCKDVSTKTGGKVKAMGNRDNPITMGATNFAGLWFIGTKDAVAQYNEAVNNVWTCNDSEAFDADMYCWGTIFQYNYTYRNNGGFALFMGSMDDGTVVRYNVSVEDAQSVGISESQNGLFHYSGAPDAIYNNLFVLGDRVATIFGGPANSTYFYNNIVIAPNGLTETGKFDGFHINGSSDGTVSNPKLSGEMKNNIFYPAKIVDSVVDGSTVVLEDNIVLKDDAEMKSLFENLDVFMNAQPVKALLGRSDMTGSKVTTDPSYEGKGAGVAMSPEAGKSVKTPTGGFDLTQFAGIRLAKNSPALRKGTTAMHDYDYKAQNDAAYPLTEDFFKNDISGQTVVDIGPHQYTTANAADFTELDKAILAAHEFDGKEADYSTGSWKALQAVLTAAEELRKDEYAEQSDVNAKTSALNDAVQAMVNVAGLKAAVAKVAGKTEADYTKGSWADFQNALTAANLCLGKETPTQMEVDGYTADLTAKADALISVKELKALADKAHKLNSADYTTATWDALQTALSLADTELGKPNATKDSLAAASKALQTALDGLIEKAPVSLEDPSTGIIVDAPAGSIPDDVTLRVAPVAEGALNSIQQALASVGSKVTAWDIALLKNGVEIEPSGKITVTIPVPAGYDSSRLALYCFPDGGDKTEVPFTVENGKLRFTVDSLSVFAVVERAKTPTTPPTTPPTTGEASIPFVLLAGVLIAAACTALLLLRRREKSSEQ